MRCCGIRIGTWLAMPTRSNTTSTLRDEFAPDDLGLDLDRVHELDDVSDGAAFYPQDHRIMWLIIGQTCRADAVSGCQGDGAVSLHDQFLKCQGWRLFEFRERRYQDVQQICAAIGPGQRGPIMQ